VSERLRRTEQRVSGDNDLDRIPARVDELMSQMTPSEKAGQLTQYFYLPLRAGTSAEPGAGTDQDAQPRMVEEALGRGEVLSARDALLTHELCERVVRAAG